MTNTTHVRIFTSSRKIVTLQELPQRNVGDILVATVPLQTDGSPDYLSKNGLHAMTLDYYGKPLLILSKFAFYPDAPRRAHHPNSQAQYLLWHRRKHETNGFLLQYLPPKSTTTKHYHTKQTEKFNVLEGSVLLQTPETDIELIAGQSHTVTPHTIHRLITQEAPSLTLIEIKDVDYKDHQTVEG